VARVVDGFLHLDVQLLAANGLADDVAWFAPSMLVYRGPTFCGSPVVSMTRTRVLTEVRGRPPAGVVSRYERKPPGRTFLTGPFAVAGRKALSPGARRAEHKSRMVVISANHEVTGRKSLHVLPRCPCSFDSRRCTPAHTSVDRLDERVGEPYRPSYRASAVRPYACAASGLSARSCTRSHDGDHVPVFDDVGLVRDPAVPRITYLPYSPWEW
jgi:hypothetical protein